jgi:uncharacterized membrane-anchored protein
VERPRRIALPPVHGWYWLTMLIAGTLGTALGDFTSFRLGLGLGGASLTLSAIVVALLWIGSAGVLANAVDYWLSIVAVRAAGTAAGDFFAHRAGLAVGTIAAGAVLVLLLSLSKERAALPKAAEEVSDLRATSR